jgi:multimeric flavodoxin WrbA
MEPAEVDDQSVCIILGSARADGITALAVERLRCSIGSNAKIINLLSLDIERFDYTRTNDRDDFRSVINEVLVSRHVVFATPVYWYSMSGVMKTFFDRLTDLLLEPGSRTVARALAGRDVWLLATGTDESLPLGFEEPFARTATYLGMNWRNAFYARSSKHEPLCPLSLAEVEALAERLSEGREPA